MTKSFLLKFAISILVLTSIEIQPVFAQGRASTMKGMALSNDEPIQIESAQMDVDDEKGQAVFSGNVEVVQGDTLLRARKMVVHYSKGSSITSGASEFDKIDVTGSVMLQSGSQMATADFGSINMVSQVITLSGKEVVLTEGESVFLGCKLTVKMESGEARLEGCGDRIKFLIDPKSRQQ